MDFFSDPIFAAMSLSKTLPLAGGQPQSAGEKTAAPDEFQKLMEKAQAGETAQTSRQPQETGGGKDAPKAEAGQKQEETGGETEEAVPPQEDAQTVAMRLLQTGLAPVDLSGTEQVQPELLPTTDERQDLVVADPVLDTDGEAAPVLAGARELAGAVETQERVPVQPQAAAEGEIQAAPQAMAELAQPQDNAGQTAAQDQPQPQAQTRAPEEPQTRVQVQPQTDEQPQTEFQPHIQPKAEQAGTDMEAFSDQSGDGEEEPEIVEAGAAPQPLFQDVKAAPVKVGEAYPASAEGETAEVSAQIGGQLTQALAQGESHVEIQLTPESLGRVTVEITQTQDGGLHVALSAESSQTRGLLERHALNLQNLLSGRGQEIVQVEVQRGEESQQNQNQHPYDGRNGANEQQKEQQQEQQQQEQERRRQSSRQGQDFLHQLRLGLFPAVIE